MAAPFQWSLAALETLMAEDQMDQHAAVLRAFSVVELWRLRRVCRAFHRWGTAALAALPRVVVVGGTVAGGESTAAVEVLDLSTLRWSSGLVPALPAPRSWHAACGTGDSGVVVVGAWEGGQDQRRAALQWVPGAAGWTPLPDLAEGRAGAASAALPDGRAMVMGGTISGEQTTPWACATCSFTNTESATHCVVCDSSRPGQPAVVALAADGSGWSALAPADGPRPALLLLLRAPAAAADAEAEPAGDLGGGL